MPGDWCMPPIEVLLTIAPPCSQVDVEDLREAGVVLVDHRAERGVGAGVVDQDVDAAEALAGEFDAAAGGVLVGRVGTDADGLAGDLRRGLFRRFLCAGGKDDVGAIGRELLCDRQPDSARASGDDRGTAGEVQ